jgi:ribose 5-phosphate isomerase B
MKMKKSNKDSPTDPPHGLKRRYVSFPKKTEQEDLNFPQEHEEQLGLNIRMIPQPLEKKEETTTGKLRIGIAADHGGFKLKEFLKKMLLETDYEVIDFGDSVLKDEDDYPDFVIPLADAIAKGIIERGIAVCGSGVGASIAANKVAGVRACLITETFSAKQGVEDDNMNVISLGGRVITDSLASELVTIFLKATFSNAERHNRRLEKVSVIEKRNKAEK